MPKGELKYNKSEFGGTVDFAGEGTLVLDIREIPETSHTALAVHGLFQIVGDAAAAPKGTPIAQRFGSAQKAYDNLKAGLFGVRTKGEPREEPIDLLAQALVNLSERGLMASLGDKAQTAEKLKGLAKAVRDGIRKVPEVAVEVATLRAAASKSTIAVTDIGKLFTPVAPTA